MAAVTLALGACSDEPSIVEPGPGPEDSTTTTVDELVTSDSADDGDESADSDDIVDDSQAESVVDGSDDAGDGNGDSDEDGTSTLAGTGPPSDDGTRVIIEPDSPNAATWQALSDSGLTFDQVEQECADDEFDADENEDRDVALLSAIRACAEPATLDDFAAELLPAGGTALPPSEASCVSTALRTDETTSGFWLVLLGEEQFDFLAADRDVQNSYLSLYSSCVSVGRALSDQFGGVLSAPTIGCIDALYADTEFVRTTIEADLSGDPDDVARVDSQIAGCLTSDERATLGRS